MKRYNLVNLPEDCKIVPDSYGDWMRVAEYEVLTVKLRDALEQIALGQYAAHTCKLIAERALEI